MPKMTLPIYIDFKSPYAYLATGPAYELERSHDVTIDWLPYTLDIPVYLGNVDDRNPHQWRRVRYSYMDARRIANKRGLTVLGPKRIFNSRPVHIAMLYADLTDTTTREVIFNNILEEFARTEKMILQITGQAELLDNEPWLQRSIQLRNPYVDPLNYIQVALMERMRKESDPEVLEKMQAAVLLSVNGVAAGLQNVG